MAVVCSGISTAQNLTKIGVTSGSCEPGSLSKSVTFLIQAIAVQPDK